MRAATRWKVLHLGRAAALAGGVLLSAGGATAQGPAPKVRPGRTTLPATRPPARRAPRPLTDEAVDQAIRRGLKYAFSVQRADGSWDTRYSGAYKGGCAALVLLTALLADVEPDDPRIKRSLAYLGTLEAKTVYVRSMRAMVYARLPGKAYEPLLADDAKWLIAQQDRSGGWGYGPAARGGGLRTDTDASNTQTAVLALRDAADAGIAVPAAVWQKVRAYWTAAQNSDGGWGYEPPGGTVSRLRGSSHGSMTAAGLACVLIASQKLAAPASAPAGKLPTQGEVVQKALAWLAKNYTVKKVPAWVWLESEQWPYYYLWCLARACNHAGVRTLGGNDWYPQLAAEVLSHQRPDGSWSGVGEAPQEGDAPIRTCLALLSLIEGRSPVLISERGAKPGLPGAVGRFARWLGGSFRKPTAWQAVSAKDGADVFSEAPLLFVNIRTPAELAALPADAIRAFVRRGGTLLVNIAVPADTTTQIVLGHFGKLFADQEYHAQKVGSDHPVWSVYYKIASTGRPKVLGLGDACRTRIFILPDNIAGPWHLHDSPASLPALQFGVNALYYTTDMQRPVGRLTARRASPPKSRAKRGLLVARVRHAGGWACCPMAVDRLSEVLTEAVSLGVKKAPPVDLSQPVPRKIGLLWMTGSADPKLTPDQAERLKAYVQAGGTVFIDATVGKQAFIDAVSVLLQQVFGTENLREIPAGDPLVTGKFGGGAGSDVREVSYTRATPGGAGPRAVAGLMGVEVNGRLGVIVSRYAVTCPLEGLPTYGCVGFETLDARRLAANVALYAMLGP